MRRSRERRFVAVALRCYPARWRIRHCDEARVLATALLDDGVPWWSITGSFLGGAAKERVLRKPNLRVGAAAAAIVMGISAVPLVLFASLAPAGAFSTALTLTIVKHESAVRQLRSAFAAHHLKITVLEKTVPSDQVGSILSLSTSPSSTNQIVEIQGQCNGGGSGCIEGLVVPLHFAGHVRVTVGVAVASRSMRRTSLASNR